MMEEMGLDIVFEVWIVLFVMCEFVIDENNYWLMVFAFVDVVADCEFANVELYKCEGWMFMFIGDVCEVDNLFLLFWKFVNDCMVVF